MAKTNETIIGYFFIRQAHFGAAGCIAGWGGYIGGMDDNDRAMIHGLYNLIGALAERLTGSSGGAM
jgi:hypothetical protein